MRFRFTMRWRGKRVIDCLEQLGLEKTDKVLDVGAGDGFITSIIREHFGCEIDAIDKGDETPDKRYDKALFISALHHMLLTDQVQRLKEAKKVAKEIIIFECEPTFWVLFLDKLLSKFYHVEHAPSRQHFIEEWVYIGKMLGFDMINWVVIEPTRLYPHHHIGIRMARK